jgi:cytidine deaminase
MESEYSMDIDHPVITDDVVETAKEARSNAYAPYSEFRVGAAIVTNNGEVYTGANIENINFSNTEHAEELALNKAIHDGHREFDALVLTFSGDPVAPCGMCRQSLSEFCDDDFEIVIPNHGVTTLGELLPDVMENIE